MTALYVIMMTANSRRYNKQTQDITLLLRSVTIIATAHTVTVVTRDEVLRVRVRRLCLLSVQQYFQYGYTFSFNFSPYPSTQVPFVQSKHRNSYTAVRNTTVSSSCVLCFSNRYDQQLAVPVKR
jgi:hypothetical protein